MFDRVRAAFDKALGYLPLTMLRGLQNPKSPSAAYLLEEKVRETVQGPGIRVRFLPLSDGYTQETPDMRQQYRVMLRDPYIKQALLTKILGVASLDLQVHPVSKSPYDKQVADFCKWAVEKSKGGLRKLVFDTLFPAMIEGYSISEKLWMIENYGQYKGKIRLKGIKSKDIKHLELMGDDFRNVTGIRDLRGWAPVGYQGYHPDNFIMYSHLSLFESPTGMSDFRAIYRAYWLIDTAWQLRGIGLERFGLPMMKGTYSHDDQKNALDTALSLMRSQSWLSLPEGAKVEALELAARGTADFESAIKDLREEIVIGIAGAMLHMMQGDAGAGARGNSKVQKSTTELQQWMLAAQVGDIITDQIFPDLVSFNYPGAEVPSATLGSVSDDEMSASLDVDKFFLTIARQPLSREAIYKAYNRQEPTSPEDTIAPPPLPSGPGGAPAPSAPPTLPPRDDGPPGADPGTDITDVPPVTPDAGPEAMTDHGSDPDFFCGGKGGTPGPCPTKSGTESSRSTLTRAVDASKAVVGKVKAGVDAIKAKLDAKTNGPVLSQVKAVFGVAKAAMDKVNAKMEQRYGKAGARAIFWGGQALGANPLVAPAWFIALPGATFIAQLPLAAGAEAILQTSRAVKGAKSAMGFAETTPAEPTGAQTTEYLTELYREFYAALEPLQGELAKTLAPLANVDKFTDQSKVIDLPDHRQKDDYDCGAATYGAVLAHHGQPIPEAELVKSLGTTKTNGTSPVAIIAHARDSGLSVSARPNMSLADLRGHINAGRPVICPIQDDEPSKESNGHYVAVIGYGPGTIHVHDPVDGRVTWPKAKFDSHWHDRDGHGVGYTRFGIAIGKGKPAPNKLTDDVSDAITKAAAETDTNPTEAQKKSGNYRKGKVTIQGLPITIENPSGSVRSGKDGSGKSWSITMANHYGYINKTESEADGDHIDVFIGPSPQSETVFVIDQKATGGTFDEHKCMIGFDGEAQAKAAYLANYSEGWQGFAGITPLSMDQFKEWIKSDDTGKPLAKQDTPELQAADSPSAAPTPTGHDVAGPHKDAAKVQSLLTDAQKNGIRVMAQIGKQAVARLLKNGPSRTTRMFSDGERKQLADALAATNATANLLGRARLYIRKDAAEKAHKEGHKFADSNTETDFSRFDEPKYIKPMAPAKALSYFKSLVPTMAPPANFAPQQYADAFRLAVDADEVVLGRVKDVIANRIESGKGIRSAPAEIDAILEEAGIASANPQYSEMVMRTNTMQAYNKGSQDAFDDPDVADFFPTWQYLGIKDGRQGADHAPHFDKYYDREKTFAEIRGDRVFNCRCVASAVNKFEWKALQESGVTVG